jgi:hypothetical protein
VEEEWGNNVKKYKEGDAWKRGMKVVGKERLGAVIEGKEGKGRNKKCWNSRRLRQRGCKVVFTFIEQSLNQSYTHYSF